MTTDERACLNCGAELSGPFCATCGQRAIPAYPTVKEMAGDAWHEMSGVDGWRAPWRRCSHGPVS